MFYKIYSVDDYETMYDVIPEDNDYANTVAGQAHTYTNANYFYSTNKGSFFFLHISPFVLELVIIHTKDFYYFFGRLVVELPCLQKKCRQHFHPKLKFLKAN